jgi:hypothetical protein
MKFQLQNPEQQQNKTSTQKAREHFCSFLGISMVDTNNPTVHLADKRVTLVMRKYILFLSNIPKNHIEERAKIT